MGVESNPTGHAVLSRLTQWGRSQDSIRALLLYSSRANPQARVDRFSDYDVLLAVDNVRNFHLDDSWIYAFGEVMVVLRNPLAIQHGFEMFVYVTHYLDGTKIDYAFYPTSFLHWAAKQPNLPDDLDNGYRVLFDKDSLTAGLGSPTYQAYLPIPPTEDEYQATVSSFFNDALYVAKAIRRADLFQLKYCLDYVMKFGDQRQMLEWRLGIKHNWTFKPGAYGKGLKKHIESSIWNELERTYVGAGDEENWQALFASIILFRKVALDVAVALGFSYPHEMDDNVVRYLHRVRGFD